MEKVYKIVPIKSCNLKEFKSENLNHKVLYKNLLDDIKLFENIDDKNIKIYSLFGVDFLVVSSNTKEEVDSIELKSYDIYEEGFSYYCYFKAMVDDNNGISKILRSSETLNIDGSNSYISHDLKFVISEKGFYLSSCFLENKEDKNAFGRFLLLYLLALSYNRKAEEFLQKVSSAYKNDNFDEMVKIRDEIYYFDLNYYFYNPVYQYRHQAYSIWNLISKNYEVKIKHDEIKSQIIEFTNVIEIKNREIEQQKEKIAKENEDKKSDKRNLILTSIGLLIAFFTFLTAFN